MTMNPIRNAVAVTSLILLSGCVSAPPEVVELADVVAEQSTSLETAHRNLVGLYFRELENRIDSFVDNKWAPSFLDRAIQNQQVQDALKGVQAGLAIDPDELRSKVSRSNDFSATEVNIIVAALESAQFDYRVQLAEIMIAFSEEAIRQIEKARKDLKAPLKEQERELTASLNQGYANLHQGQAVLQAYLASVVEIVEQQDRVLKKLELIDERDKAMDTIVKVSEEAANAANRIDELGNVIDSS